MNSSWRCRQCAQRRWRFELRETGTEVQKTADGGTQVAPGAERSVGDDMTGGTTSELEFDTGRRVMPHPILQSRRIGERILVVFDPMDFPRCRQARNLVAYDLNGNELWTAEHPTNETADCYVNFVSDEPLWVGNFAGFTCRIDLETGKLLEAVFTK